MSDTGVSRRDFIKILVGAAASPLWLAQACSKEDESPHVNFFNWSAYIAKNTIPDFTKQTGIKVNYDVFADEDEMFAKLRSGGRGYDLIVGTDYMIPKLKALNIISPIPAGSLKNIGNIDPKFRHAPYDPDDAFTVPYLWGTTGIGYNKKYVAQEPKSWRALWDKKYEGKISILDNIRDCIGLGLLLCGYPETTQDEKAYDAVSKLYLEQKPLVRSYASASYTDSLIAGEVWLAMAWSGDILQIVRENPHIDYVIPDEGSYLWMDNLCLIRGGGRRRKYALELIDYLIEGRVAADIADSVRYASPDAAAYPLMDKSLSNDPRAYPPSSVYKRLRFHDLIDPETFQLWKDAWTDIKVS